MTATRRDLVARNAYSYGSSLEERFFARIDRDTQTGCWLWLAGRDEHGYAKITKALWGEKRAHRWAYKHFVGPVPDGLTLDHLCMVKHCVNPAHLDRCSGSVNSSRYWDAVSGLCRRRLHVMTPENTGRKSGRRFCRACGRAARARRFADPDFRAAYNAQKLRTSSSRREEINRRARENYARRQARLREQVTP